MKLIKAGTLFIVLLIATALQAQKNSHGQCGVLPHMQDMDRLMENKLRSKNIDFQRKGATYFIPIKLHLVARNDGTGRITEKRAMEGICKLNEYFAPMDMQFYLKGDFNEINSDAMYDLEYPNVPAAVRFLYTAAKVDNAANVFIGNGMSSGNSGYYTPSHDVIYMDRQYVNSRDNILAHEFGHFFSLAHTFYGWEAIPDDPDASSGPAPTHVNGRPVEYVDRNKNCDHAADGFCDTPADYLQDWGGACDYTGGALDPDGVEIDPDEQNLMAYFSFRGCPEYYFSQGQMDAIVADFVSRKDMSDLSAPNQQEVTDLATLVSPINSEAVQAGGEVIFDWEDVPGATRYYIEISPLSNFAFVEDKGFVTESNFSSSTLNSGRAEYFWRVRAFNDVYFCEEIFSAPERFVFGDASSTTDFSLLEKLSVSPNPLSGNELNVQFFNLKIPSGVVDFEIFDLSGKKVSSTGNRSISQGQNEITLSVSNLDAGIYILNIVSEEGILLGRQKVVRI